MSAAGEAPGALYARRMTAERDGRVGGWGRVAVVAACAGVLVAGAVPLILSGLMTGRPGLDQGVFHERAIRIFAHDWPRFDFEGYLAATTPLYHLLIAAVCRFVTDSRVGLQTAGMLISVALIALLAWACTARGRLWLALAATLAAFSSHYLFFPAVWLLPDNLGWLGVLGVMLLCMQRDGAWRPLVMAAAVLVPLVLTRQSHIWAAAMIWAAAWMGREGAGAGVMERARRVGVAMALTLPAFLAVAWFVRLWGGLTPPLFQGMNQAAPGDGEGAGSLAASVLANMNPATPAFLLAVIGVHGAFFLVSLAPAGVDLWRRHRWVLAGVVAGALLVSVVPATTHDLEAGRSRGVWGLAARTPEIMGHTSPAIVALAVLGGVVLAMMCRKVGKREAVVMVVGLAAFGASLAASKHLWQRYTAPLVLMMLALTVCRGEREGEGGLPVLPVLSARGWRRAEVVGPLVLAVIFGVSSARLALYDHPQPPRDEAWLLKGMFPNGGGPERLRLRPEDPRYPVRAERKGEGS